MELVPNNSPPQQQSALEGFAQLDLGYRRPVGYLYAAYSEGLKGRAGIETLWLAWIVRYRLTTADVAAVCTRMIDPREVSRLKFPMEITARLGELVAELVARRKRERAAAELRTNPITPATRAHYRRLAAGVAPRPRPPAPSPTDFAGIAANKTAPAPGDAP